MDEGVLKEYEQLRTEILHADRLCLEAMSIAFAAASLLLGYGVEKESAFVCIAPVPLLWIASLYVADKRWVIWLIASYLRTYIESPESGIRWESRLAVFRDRARDQPGSFCPTINMVLVECLTFNAMGLVCSALYAFFVTTKHLRPQEPGWELRSLYYLVAVFAIAGLSTLTYRSFCRLRAIGHSAETLDNLWPKDSTPPASGSHGGAQELLQAGREPGSAL
jgi:hypothetical protein